MEVAAFSSFSALSFCHFPSLNSFHSFSAQGIEIAIPNLTKYKRHVVRSSRTHRIGMLTRPVKRRWSFPSSLNSTVCAYDFGLINSFAFFVLFRFFVPFILIFPTSPFSLSHLTFQYYIRTQHTQCL